jgi:hypothetical protein
LCFWDKSNIVRRLPISLREPLFGYETPINAATRFVLILSFIHSFIQLITLSLVNEIIIFLTRANQTMKTYYKRIYPHINPIGVTYFITFRLLNSIPKKEIQKLKKEYYIQFHNLEKIENSVDRNREILDYRKRYCGRYEDLLHDINSGPMILAEDKIMDLVSEQIHRFDNELYKLVCYSIMSNNGHILIEANLSGEVSKIETFEKKLFDNHTHLSYALIIYNAANKRSIIAIH